jgi:protein-S-isoprenylcysteine O-methyltransferase Ste14
MWHKFLIKSGNLFFRFRNFLFPALCIILFILTRPAYFLGSRALDRIVVALGITAALAGEAFRLLVIGFAYIKRGGKDGRVYADNLVTEGFYAHVRNPMYIGNFLILAGLGMIYGSAWVYFFMIPFFSFAYYSIVVTEENYLRGHFGQEYEQYCKKVNRFSPNFGGIRKSLRQFHYDWRKAIRKDYGTFFGVLVGCVATLLWKRYYFYGLPKSKTEALVAGLPFILIAICYTAARYLKKSGRLKSPSQ